MFKITTGSGYLNNPPRTILVESDNRPGSYPTLTSPVDAARSSDFNRPFRDTLTMETPVVYSRASVNFFDVPRNGDYVQLVNAGGITHKFVFTSNFTSFVITTNTYAVDLTGVRSSTGNSELGLNAKQVTINNVVKKFISAVNTATSSLMTAKPSKSLSEVILTQTIPGSVGNTSNNSSTAKIVVTKFSGGNNSSVRYPFGVHVADGNTSTSEAVRRVISTTRSGTLDVPTSGDSRLLEGYSDQHGFGAFSPFDESNSYQSFGISTGGSEKYGTQTKLYDEFFTRGSVSGSLDEPLNVKDKIVIDLTPVDSTTLAAKDTPNQNFPMAYFNFQTRKWEKIGLGNNASTAASASIKDELDTNYVGFAMASFNAAIGSNAFSNVKIFDPNLRENFTGNKKIFQYSGWNSPTDTFGFPVHPKYHATSSQCLDMSSLIDRPFVVEKLVYEFSGSSSNNDNITSLLTKGVCYFDVGGGTKAFLGTGGVFFILNQRKSNPDPGQESSYTNYYYASDELGTGYYPPDYETGLPVKKATYDMGGIPQYLSLSNGASPSYVDSTRDLVTFARVGAIWDTYDQEVVDDIEPGFPHPAKFMDLAAIVPASGTLDGYYTVAADIKSPTNVASVSTWNLKYNLGGVRVYVTKDSSTRNSLDISTGRALRNEFCGPEISYKAHISSNNLYTFGLTKDSLPSPYILYPSDKLIFGWQSPVAAGGDLYDGSYLTIGKGKGRLVLYGSYLCDDKPVHNIYKDHLNSDAAHEAIPSGPAVLDMFDTSPAMMYTGSLREEFITGSMVSYRDGVYSITDPSNLKDVRMISARVSDGNVKQRYSFFRNTRLIDSQEQYYDSMQPDPLKMLTLNSNIGERFNVGAHLGLMLPGSVYYDDGGYDTFINAYFNKRWIGSFPFESRYSGIQRLKTINRNVLSRNKITTFNGTPGLKEEIIGIVFATPTGSLTPGASAVPNLLAPGGITEYGLDVTKTHVFPNVSIDDTESFDSTSYLDDNIANPAQERRTLQGSSILYQFSRFMGCFGSGYFQLVQFKELQQVDLDSLFVRGMLYRGVKHGLINPIPLFSNTVFNGSHYGQFRDMLEQRQYTRFCLNDNTLTDTAVNVVFINRSAEPGTMNVTSGSATNSSNISSYATSEHPYDDAIADYGQIWDRESVLPESLEAI